MSNDDKIPIAKIALQRAVVEPDHDLDALRNLSERYGVPAIDLAQVCIRLRDLDFLPREVAERRRMLPVLVHDERLFVAMTDPDDRKTIDELEFVTAKRVFAYVALPDALERAVTTAYDARANGEAFYIAPRCPPEVQRKARAREASRAASMLAPATGAFEQEAQPREATARPPSIAPPALEAAAARDDLSYTDFGDLNPEHSVVTDVPDENVRPGAGPTILVVDDEADIRRMLRRVLTERGYHVLEADRGLEALRMVKTHLPALLVLDAMLPEIHGFDIARRIRGSAKYGHIPIVMVSAVYRGWRVAEDAKASYGVDAFIEKPFRIADVVAAVERALASAPSPSRAPEHESLAPPVRAPQTMPAGRPEPVVSAAPSARGDLAEEAERFLTAGVAAYRSGDLDGAIAQLVQGVGIDPFAFRLHFHLGLLYGKKGMLYEAIGELERAGELNAHHFSALKNLAVLYQKAGMRQKAIEAWSRAVHAAPDAVTADSIREHLRELAVTSVAAR